MTDFDELNGKRLEADNRRLLDTMFDPNVYAILVFLAMLLSMALSGCHEPPEPFFDRPALSTYLTERGVL